jgi:transposase-like protein
MTCPSCQSNKKQYKSGFNRSGSQRYRCGVCSRAYTPAPKENGYPAETHLLAIRMYVEGNSTRAIGRILEVSPQSVANWVSAYTDRLPGAALPKDVHTAELDELYTFIGSKKTKSTS